MSEDLQNLCCAIVDEYYGEFHSRIFAQLAYHGRLSASQIAQRMHQSIRQIKYGLATLAQSRMIYHHTTNEGFSTYQANFDTSYNLIRIGRLAELARCQFGDLAAHLITEAAQLGFTTLKELQLRIIHLSAAAQIDLMNGSHDNSEQPLKSDEQQLDHVYLLIQDLVEHEFLLPVRAAHLQTQFDVKQDIGNLLKVSGSVGAAKVKKVQQEIEDRIDADYRNRISIRATENGYIPTIPTQDKPNHAHDRGSSAKRLKSNGSAHDSSNGYEWSTGHHKDKSDGLLLSVSTKNVVDDIRNARLTTRARTRLGNFPCQVLNAALSQVPTKIPWVKETNQHRLDSHDLEDRINRRKDNTLTNGHQESGNVQANGVCINSDAEDVERFIPFSEIELVLKHLSHSQFAFLRGSPGGAWTIHKQEMDDDLQQQEIMRMMSDQLGLPSLRIVRMLKDRGKLDEKTLQELGLLGAKELRQTLADLKQAGYIDLQEVPREAQRQPNRTIFLWFHDSSRVQKVLLDNAYKSMTRLLQKLKTERGKVSSTLEKVERSDVKGNEDEIMSAAELRVLKRWQRTEQWLMGEVVRLDASVALLRDL